MTDVPLTIVLLWTATNINIILAALIISGGKK